MSDQILADLPKTICEEIQIHLPNLKQCEPHAGKFNLEELKKAGVKAPAVRVSILGAGQDTTFGTDHSFMLSMAAYVVTKDGLGLKRDVAAANICQALLQIVPGQDWGFDPVGEARSVKMHSLVTSKSKDVGASLWAVTWDQPITFTPRPATAPLGVELYVGHAPGGIALAVDDYVEFGGATNV